MDIEFLRIAALVGAFACMVFLVFCISWAICLLLAAVGGGSLGAATRRSVHVPGQRMLQGCLRFFDAVLGPRTSTQTKLGAAIGWPPTYPFTRLALIYWVAGMTIAIVFTPVGDSPVDEHLWQWRPKSGLWLLSAVHVWLWSSAIVDCLSFNYSRNRIQDFLKYFPKLADGDSRALSLCMQAWRRDVVVATICLIAVLFISNNTYWMAMRSDPGYQLSYVSTVFNPQTVFADFGSYQASTQPNEVAVDQRIPGILVTAATCFVPTALWLGTGLALLVTAAAFEVRKFFDVGWRAYARDAGWRAAREHSRGHTTQWGLCLGGLLGSYTGALEFFGMAL